jgi:branched-chain amino acid transport system substrate-binding protein
MGDVALGVINSHHYSAAHPSADEQEVRRRLHGRNKFRPNFMAVGGYDGMRVIYKALKASKGAGGDALLAGMKGQLFESPRGQVLHRRAVARHRARHVHPQGREEATASCGTSSSTPSRR